MPRNGSGSYSLPEAPFIPGTPISSTAVNSDFSDIGSALTYSVASDGQTPITGPLKGAAGSVALPGYAFNIDPDCGWYRIGANNIGIAVNATKIVDIATTGVGITGDLSATDNLSAIGNATIGGTLTATGLVTVTAGFVNTISVISTDAGASVAPTVDVYRNSASPAALDALGTLQFTGKDSGGNKTVYGWIVAQIADPTDGTEDGTLSLQAMVNGALTAVLYNNGTGIVIPGSLAVSGSITPGTPAFTQQVLTSGTTYNRPANCRAIRVQMIGGGGGGGGANSGAGNGGTGGTTSFNSLTVLGGSGGVTASGSTNGGAGGTGGTATNRVAGSGGSSGSPDTVQSGGSGGSGFFGGNGAGVGPDNTNGLPAATNSGAGGGGATAGSSGGGGGGSGEYGWFTIASPASSYAYAIGAAGAAGAGSNPGGAGGSGLIIVDEFY